MYTTQNKEVKKSVYGGGKYGYGSMSMKDVAKVAFREWRNYAAKCAVLAVLFIAAFLAVGESSAVEYIIQIYLFLGVFIGFFIFIKEWIGAGRFWGMTIDLDD